jgi:hypothetical protein
VEPVTAHAALSLTLTTLAGVLMIASGMHRRLLERRNYARCASCGRALRRGACETCARRGS